VYPTLLMSLASNPNNTLFVDDYGTSYLIDTSEPIPTETEYAEIYEAAYKTNFLLYTR